ncbi:ABC transporter permease [Gordonia sp. CPCC 205333]|uniref:ABC transporter permease n=1 Tax=Gordonia sp. CPCC 205333 TaxID=3140790 RepID=UPI003AF38166
MTTLTYTLADSSTMLRRNLRHMLRYPVLTVLTIGTPVILLLIFVYVLGGTLGSGLPTGATGSAPNADSGTAAYLRYVVPGILLIAIVMSAQGTAISVAMDMREGIVARFRTMAISRASVLTGHVIGAVAQTIISVIVVFAVAVALGFRTSTDIGSVIAALGFVALVALAITWIAVGMGIAAKSVESASNTPMILLLLPFLSSGFVPTDSMPSAIAWFAAHQPFTPFIETVRALLLGTPMGSNAFQTVLWCIGLSVVGYVWSMRLYNKSSLN